jgi:hypothetical protein
MERSTSGDVERDLERTGDELEERLGHLDGQIEDARHEATARSEDADQAEDDPDADDPDGTDPGELDDPEAVDEDEEE